jgi:hypothetical protein
VAKVKERVKERERTKVRKARINPVEVAPGHFHSGRGS